MWGRYYHCPSLDINFLSLANQGWLNNQSGKTDLLFSCSVVSDSVIPWIAAYQASLFITNSRSLLKLMSIELVMSSNHVILCRLLPLCLQSFPTSGSFLTNQFFRLAVREEIESEFSFFFFFFNVIVVVQFKVS